MKAFDNIDIKQVTCVTNKLALRMVPTSKFGTTTFATVQHFLVVLRPYNTLSR